MKVHTSSLNTLHAKSSAPWVAELPYESAATSRVSARFAEVFVAVHLQMHVQQLEKEWYQ